MTFDMRELLGKTAPALRYTPDEGFTLPTCRVGIELEIEGVPRLSDRQRQVIDPYWSVIQEGSLRNSGKEFVLRNPLFGCDLRNSINTLCDMIEHYRRFNNRQFTKSPRTSTHIHLDVSDVEHSSQLFSFLALYLALERPLFKYFNDQRDGNVFCLPLYRSPHVVSVYRAFLCDDPKVAHNILHSGIGARTRQQRNMGELVAKYSALNIRPMFNLGSVEFRHAPALTTSADLIEWINIIQSLKKAALEHNYLEENIAHQFSDRGPEAILEDVMGPELANKLFYPELREDVMKGIRLTQTITLMAQAQEIQDKIQSSVGLQKRISNFVEYSRTFGG